MSDRIFITVVLLLAPAVVLVSAAVGGWLYRCGRENKSPLPSLPKPRIKLETEKPEKQTAPPMRLRS